MSDSNFVCAGEASISSSASVKGIGRSIEWQIISGTTQRRRIELLGNATKFAMLDVHIEYLAVEFFKEDQEKESVYVALSLIPFNMQDIRIYNAPSDLSTRHRRHNHQVSMGFHPGLFGQYRILFVNTRQTQWPRPTCFKSINWCSRDAKFKKMPILNKLPELLQPWCLHREPQSIRMNNWGRTRALPPSLPDGTLIISGGRTRYAIGPYQTLPEWRPFKQEASNRKEQLQTFDKLSENEIPALEKLEVKFVRPSVLVLQIFQSKYM